MTDTSMLIFKQRMHHLGWMVGALMLSSCKLGDLVDVDRPISVTNPDAVESARGALSLRDAAVSTFALAYGGHSSARSNYAGTAGVMSDEFYVTSSSSPPFPPADYEINLRILPEVQRTGSDRSGKVFRELHNARLSAEQAIGALGISLPERSWLRGELYALKGFAEIMLGEMFCSGVPLSSAPFGGNVTYGHPYTTEQLFEHAVMLFDSALVLSADSARISNLARLGKGRALLNLNRLNDAASTVSTVPTSYSYQLTYITTPTTLKNGIAYEATLKWFGVASSAGGVGMNYATSGDPRVPITNLGVSPNGATTSYYPAQYANDAAPMILTSGIEARLIEAEQQFRGGGSQWVTTLNTLRQTGRSSAMPALTADSTTGATPAMQRAVLFRERAFWLFSKGQRLGDMRRLIRQYNMPQEAVFPSGQYYGGGYFYGTDVNAPMPYDEYGRNPYVKGCLNRDA